jgi:hypothetical protein
MTSYPNLASLRFYSGHALRPFDEAQSLPRVYRRDMLGERHSETDRCAKHTLRKLSLIQTLRLCAPSTRLRTCLAGDIPRLSGARSAPHENFLLSKLCAFAPLRETFRDRPVREAHPTKTSTRLRACPEFIEGTCLAGVNPLSGVTTERSTKCVRSESHVRYQPSERIESKIQNFFCRRSKLLVPARGL